MDPARPSPVSLRSPPSPAVRERGYDAFGSKLLSRTAGRGGPSPSGLVAGEVGLTAFANAQPFRPVGNWSLMRRFGRGQIVRGLDAGSVGRLRVETQFYDTLETRDPAEREAALMSALPQIIAAAKERAPAYRHRLAGVHPEDVVDRRSLAELPLTRKSELIELQRQNPPFGGLAASPISALRRVFVSPGPIYEPEGRRPDYWRFARALFAAGFRAGDLVHNTFSYHLTPAGAMVESGAEALGCPVIPAGTGQTEQQLRTIADLRPVGYVGTPSFLKVLLDRAASEGGDTSSLKKALVGAEALPSALRAEFAAAGSACCSATGPRISASSLMRARARRASFATAWWSMRGSFSSWSCRAPGSRCLPARSGRSS